ncbi:MAG TPA: Ada metal-binding domain-containing protein, partial [Acidobacteriota bacterium]|nr:Ada metal-binding domain-containing protein [Acidobacteriota bacterium]
MTLTRERMLDRMLASDSNFDGRFITGVLSTGIFCLPSCRARKPKPENVRFFPNPKEASRAGLRPCKRCRPDLFYRGRDPQRERLVEVIESLRRNPARYRHVADLADEAGIGTSKLNQQVRRYYQSTPAALLLRYRLRMARRMLLQGGDKVADVAFACGFESLSVFNQQFRRSQRMTPSSHRALRQADSFVIDLPAPYPLAFMLDYWGRDPESLSERVAGRTLRLALRLDERPLAVQVDFQSGAAVCRLLDGAPRPGSAARVHGRLLAMLGLDQDPRPFQAALTGQPRLAPLLRLPGLRIPRLAGRVEGLIWVIVGQQVNLPFAYSLRRTLYRLAGTSTPSGLTAAPRPQDLAGLDIEDLRRRRFSRQKASYLIGVGEALLNNEVPSPSRLHP